MSSSSGGSDKSLTAIRRKEAKRVRTQESATVAMLSSILDDGDATKKNKKKRRKLPSEGGKGGGSGIATIGRSGSSFRSSAGVVPGRKVSTASRTTNAISSTTRVTGAGGGGGGGGAWSDIVTAASRSRASNVPSNPFGRAASSTGGDAGSIWPGGAARHRHSKPANAVQMARSQSLARKRAAIVKKAAAAAAAAAASKKSSNSANTLKGATQVAPMHSSVAGGSSTVTAGPTSIKPQSQPQFNIATSAKSRPSDCDSDITTGRSRKTHDTSDFEGVTFPTSPSRSQPEIDVEAAPSVKLGISLLSRPIKHPARSRDLTANSAHVTNTRNDDIGSAIVGEIPPSSNSTISEEKMTANSTAAVSEGEIPFYSGKAVTTGKSYGNDDAPYTRTDANLQRDATKNATKSNISNTTGSTMTGSRQKKRRAVNNDNFVRLNMRNSAGSCRGARKKGKKSKSSWGSRYKNSYDNSKRDGRYATGGGSDDDEEDNEKDWKTRRKEKDGVRLVQNSSAGIDPLDDYLDGTYVSKNSIASATIGTNDQQPEKAATATSTEKNSAASSSSILNDEAAAVALQASQTKARSEKVPRCIRHRRPCKLLTVKKSNTGNKGRKFYVCSLPRGEQCDHFQWEDDTVQSIQRALLQSSSTSGFVARQVAAYVDRFKALTLPELRDEAKRLGLRHVGKKGQLLARLTIHVRDEVAKAVNDEKMQIGTDSSASTIDKENVVKSDIDDFAQISTGIDPTDSAKGENGGSSRPASSEDDASTSSEDDDSISSEDDELELVVDEADDDDEASMDAESDDAADNPDTNSPGDPIQEALRKYFGYNSFRPGQEWAIRRVLNQERSLLVAPTGLGKSLCYALPATQMEGVCLVVSPLISLMQDQLRHLPPNIPAATLSGNLSSTQVAMTIDDLMKNRIKILFVSPERLASSAFRRLIRPKYNTEKRQYERQFPTVSLLCLDEAHCLSQWGHNFRPSYLRIRSLVPLLEPKSILALTATAGPMVIGDICHTLHIPHLSSTTIGTEDTSISTNNDGVRVLDCRRDNIDISTIVLDSEDARRSLLYKVLKDKKDNDFDGREFRSNNNANTSIQAGCLAKGSVIVYVWRQRDAETVTEQLIGAGIQGGVVCYHGGMGAGERAKAQGKFMRGKARVCVATVAFGLGINKADVKGVIHMCLPPSLEHYLQEIGRAGRNGKPARAIALVLSDEVKVRSSLSYSDYVARSQVETLCRVMQNLVDSALKDTALEQSGESSAAQCMAPLPIIDVALPLSSTVDAIDCKEAMIETMLSLLEENSPQTKALLSVEGNLIDDVIITLKRRSLDTLASQEAIIRAIAQCSQRLDEKNTASATTENSVGVPSNPLEERLRKDGGTAQQKGFLAYSLGTYKFSVLRCARFMGPRAEPRHVFAALRRLQSSGELELALDRTEKGKSLHLRINSEGIACFRSPSDSGGNSAEALLEKIIDRLTSHCSQQVHTGAAKVEKMHQCIHQVATIEEQDAETENGSDGDVDNASSHPSPQQEGKSSRLVLFQKLSREYFENEGNGYSAKTDDADDDSNDAAQSVPLVAKELSASSDPREYAQLVSDTLSLMRDSTLKQKGTGENAVNITDRDCADYASCCITKILHGIDSVRAPMSDWRSHPIFGKWRHCTFTSVLSAVETIIREN